MADIIDHSDLKRRLGQRSKPHLPRSACERGRDRLVAALLPLLIVVGLALTPAVSVHAAPASQQSYNYSKQAGISVEQAAAMVRRETGGRVLSANPTKSNGQRGYNIRVLVDGKRIKQYYVDDQGRMSPK